VAGDGSLLLFNSNPQAQRSPMIDGLQLFCGAALQRVGTTIVWHT